MSEESNEWMDTVSGSGCRAGTVPVCLVRVENLCLRTMMVVRIGGALVSLSIHIIHIRHLRSMILPDDHPGALVAPHTVVVMSILPPLT
jgi:hypothetical protein